jgi:hypothetical protein
MPLIERRRLAADLQRVAGQADWRTGPRRELDRAGGAEIVEDAAGAAGAVEAGESEDFSGDEPARLIRRHHPGECGAIHRTGHDGSQHQTRNISNSNFTRAAGQKFLYPLLTIPTVAKIGAGWLVKSEYR